MSISKNINVYIYTIHVFKKHCKGHHSTIPPVLAGKIVSNQIVGFGGFRLLTNLEKDNVSDCRPSGCVNCKLYFHACHFRFKAVCQSPSQNKNTLL